MSDTGAEAAKGLQAKRTYQPTFSAGELSPSLHWRSDLAKWRAGAAAMVNFIGTAQGSAARRAGTQFVTFAKDNTGVQRLVPFQFSTEQQYVLELGFGYMRFITQGAYVTLGGSPYEISTPYSYLHLFELNFVQSADVLTIVHPSYQPRELKRLGTTSWTLTALSVGTTMAAPTGLSATATFTTAVTGSPLPSDHTYEYAVSATSSTRHDEGPLSSSATCVNKDLGYFNQFGYRNQLAWSAVTGADFYTVYRKYQGVWSKIAATVDLSFEDTNFIPNTASGPPAGTDPFTGTNWPATVGYFQERRVFGGSNADPETLWFSKSGNYTNFDVADPVKDDDAITYTLAARQVNQIRHLLPLADLIVMTGGGGWKVSATGAVTPSNIDVSPQSFVGASQVTPQVIGNRILFIEAKGASVREIAYQFVQNQYVSEDRGVFSEHLLNGHVIVSWAWAESPDKVLWMCRDDGALLSLTYLPEQDVYCWAQHFTAGGLFRSVAVISEPGPDGVVEDTPYFVVLRGNPSGPFVTFIERMHTRRLGVHNDDLTKAWFVDCALQYSGSAATTISGLTHLADGTVVDYLADGVSGTATLSGGAFTLPVAASTVTAGLPFPAVLTTLPADSTRPGEDPWLGRLKHGFRARLAVRNAVGLQVDIDGSPATLLVDPDTGLQPAGLTTGVLETRTGEGWARNGQLSIHALGPYPVTVCGLALEWEVGE